MASILEFNVFFFLNANSINSPPDGCNSIDLIVRGRKLEKPGFESSVVLLTYPQGWGLLTKGVVCILSGSVHS